jgi:hypothetical protein
VEELKTSPAWDSIDKLANLSVNAFTEALLKV